MHPLYAQARTWLGTRFRHQGRVKNSGVDCLGLIIGAASELQFEIATLDERSYSKIPDGKYLLEKLLEHLEMIFLVVGGQWSVVSKKDSGKISANCELRTANLNLIQSGDILLFELDGNPQHLAIADVCKVTGKIKMIHSYLAAGKVVENHLEEPWISNLVGCFRVIWNGGL